MVGRDLPKLCPLGEDHQGLREPVGGGRSGSGRSARLAWRSWIVTIQIHKALVWILRKKTGLRAMHFILPGPNWPRLGLEGVMWRRILQVRRRTRRTQTKRSLMPRKLRCGKRKRRLYSRPCGGSDGHRTRGRAR